MYLKITLAYWDETGYTIKYSERCAVASSKWLMRLLTRTHEDMQ